MKLITDANLITEAKTDERTGEVYIEGIFMQTKPNRNKRKYAFDILKNAVNEYVENQVKTGRAVGELNHPDSPIVDYKNVSHRILSLEWQGENVMGKALILNTPSGKIVKGLLEGGVQLGVSSRGMGTLGDPDENGVSPVNEDFNLVTIDIVQDPSAPDAFVNSVNESVEWVKNEKGVWVSQYVDEKQNETELVSENTKLRDMKRLLSSLI
jgi:hypothetical protein